MRNEEQREIERAKNEEKREARRQEIDVLMAERVKKVEGDVESLTALADVAKGIGVSTKITGAVGGMLVLLFIWILIDRDADIKSIHGDIKSVNTMILAHSSQIESALALLKVTVETQQKDMARLDQHIDKDGDNFLGIEKRLPRNKP